MATPTVPNTNALALYQPGNFPGPEGTARFVQTELQKIAQSVTLIVQVLKQHEKRLAAGAL